MSLTTLIDTLKQLIANPTSNIVASSLALAAAVVFVLVIAVVVMLLIIRPPGTRATERQASAETPDPAGEPAEEPTIVSALRRRRAAIVLALCAIAFLAAYASSGSASYCADTCHSMQGAAATWRASTHASVACARCHETSVVDGTFTRVRHAVAAVTRHDRLVVRVRTSSLRCLSCHRSVLKGTRTGKDGITVEHGHIIAAGMECLECHSEAGHGSTRVDAGVMPECLRCHDGDLALNACFVCHEGDPSQASVSNRTFGTVTLPPPRCDGCHAAP